MRGLPAGTCSIAGPIRRTSRTLQDRTGYVRRLRRRLAERGRHRTTAPWLFSSWLAGMIAGLVLGPRVPINKNLWTRSFALFTPTRGADARGVSLAVDVRVLAPWSRHCFSAPTRNPPSPISCRSPRSLLHPRHRLRSGSLEMDRLPGARSSGLSPGLRRKPLARYAIVLRSFSGSWCSARMSAAGFSSSSELTPAHGPLSLDAPLRARRRVVSRRHTTQGASRLLSRWCSDASTSRFSRFSSSTCSAASRATRPGRGSLGTDHAYLPARRRHRRRTARSAGPQRPADVLDPVVSGPVLVPRRLLTSFPQLFAIARFRHRQGGVCGGMPLTRRRHWAGTPSSTASGLMQSGYSMVPALVAGLSSFIYPQLNKGTGPWLRWMLWTHPSSFRVFSS